MQSVEAGPFQEKFSQETGSTQWFLLLTLQGQNPYFRLDKDMCEW